MTSRKIIVVSGIVAGSTKAHAVCTMQMANGFHRLGHDVAIITRPPKKGTTKEQLQRLYGLEEGIRWEWPMRSKLLERLGFYWPFAWRILPRILRHRPDLVYVRKSWVPALTARLGIPTVFEDHQPIKRDKDPMVQASRKQAFRTWLTISPTLKDHYVTHGVSANIILVRPSPVDIQKFMAPSHVDVFGPGTHVVYTGHLYAYKGVEEVLEAARVLPEITFHFLGGDPHQIAAIKERTGPDSSSDNVVFHGHVPHDQVPQYTQNADVLLLPPRSDHISAAWTSPAKLGEYMASGIPIVASDIPALRHWLDDSMVTFVAPDDGTELAEGILQVIRHPAEAVKKANRAQSKVKQWEVSVRAQAILAHALDD